MQQLDMKKSDKKYLRNARVYCATLLFALLFSVSGLTQNYTTTTFADPAFTTVNNANGQMTDGAMAGQVSLRSAIRAADNLGGAHTITLQTGTYAIDQAQIVFGNNAQNITINGNGPTSTIIDMTGAAFVPATPSGRDRIFLL